MSQIERKDWLKMGQNERVLWWDHPSFVMHFPPMVLGAFIVLAAILVQFVPLPVEVPLKVRVGILAGGIVLGLSLILYEVIRRRYIYYVITTEKIWHTHGIISTDRNPVRYDRVVNVRVTQSYLERILSFFMSDENIGEVYVMTADDEGGDMLLENVPRIELVSQMIEDGMEGQADPDHAQQGGAAARIEGFTNEQRNRQPAQGSPQNQQRQQPPQGQPHTQNQPRQNQRGQQPPQGQGQGQPRGQGQQDDSNPYPDSQPGTSQSQPPQDQRQPRSQGQGQGQGQPRGQGQQNGNQPPDSGGYPDEQGGGDQRYPDEDTGNDDRYPDQRDDSQ